MSIIARYVGCDGRIRQCALDRSYLSFAFSAGAVAPSVANPVAALHATGYEDPRERRGNAVDAIQNCEHKLLLKADKLVVPDDFVRFWQAVKKVGKACNVAIKDGVDELAFARRKVYFFDTQAFDLYKNSFILRKRVRMADDLPTEHEVTFKFRNPDLAKARDTDVRSFVFSGSKTKFKEEILQPRDGSFGYRSVYSHNCVVKGPDVTIDRQLSKLQKDFPVLTTLPTSGDAPIVLVNDMTIDELEAETGDLDFGSGYRADSCIAIWRANAGKRPLIGEFSFQTRFTDPSAVDVAARDRSIHFYQKIQSELADWLSAGTTKTSMIYGPTGGRE